MAYRGTWADRRQLQQTLRNIRSAGLQIDQLALDMDGAKFPVSRAHLNAFLLADLDNPKKKWLAKPLRNMSDFFDQSEKYKPFVSPPEAIMASDRPDSYFFSAAYLYFNTDFNRPYGHLSNMVGTYAMFRPIWSSQMPNYFVRSIVHIEKFGDAFMMREEQHYVDPFHMQVDESSTGYLFSFGPILFSISNEITYQCRRFICVHNIVPMLSGKKSPVNRFDGEIKSIAPDDIGPPAHKFRCRKVEDKVFDCDVIRASQLLSEDQEYFEVKRGHP